MLKAIFIDHMGTLVYEQSEYLEALLKNVLNIQMKRILKRLLIYGKRSMMHY